MYIYLENNYFIPLSEIIAVVEYEKFLENDSSKELLFKNKSKIINLSENEKKTLVITDSYFYITEYTGRAIYSRGNEFLNIKYKNANKRR